MSTYAPDNQLPSQALLNVVQQTALTELFHRVIAALPDDALQDQFLKEFEALLSP